MIRQGTRLFGLGRYFWDALREINPAEIRSELQRPITVAFFGRQGSGRHTLARTLFGTDEADRPGRGLTFNGVDDAAVSAAGLPDLAFLVLDASEPDWSAERRIGARLSSVGCPVFLVVTHADKLSDPGQSLPAVRNQFPSHPPELTSVVDPRDEAQTRQRLLGRVVAAAPTIRLGLAHRYPPFRGAVAEVLTRDASRVNTQTALIASLPSLVPVLGFLIGGMADILILTKNQAMLVFKLAGIYGRDLDDKLGVLREIAPVVGGAFLWRTAARTAVGLAPAPFSMLPKATIAYIGTYVVGQAARYYYERGDRPPPEVLKQFRDDATKRYATINDVLKQRLGIGPKSTPGHASAPPEDGAAST